MTLPPFHIDGTETEARRLELGDALAGACMTRPGELVAALEVHGLSADRLPALLGGECAALHIVRAVLGVAGGADAGKVGPSVRVRGAVAAALKAAGCWSPTHPPAVHGNMTREKLEALERAHMGADLGETVFAIVALEDGERKVREADRMRAEAVELLGKAGVGVGAGRPAAGLLTVRMSEVEARPVAWLWPGRIAVGKVAVVAGAPGCGKSFLTCDLAARVTTGASWPDGARGGEPAEVLMFNAEDDPADTLRPRLDSSGADVSRVRIIRGVDAEDGGFTLADADRLDVELARRPGVRLVTLDPVGSVIGAGTDTDKDNKVRAALAPLKGIAERRGVAVVVVAHTRKGDAGGADDRVMGSRAFTGVARVVWHVVKDDGDPGRRLLLPGKNNLAPEGDGLAFRVEGDGTAARCVWEPEPVAETADGWMRRTRDGGGVDVGGGEKMRGALAFLRGKFADGEARPWAEVVTEARAAGIAAKTVRNARDTMKAAGELVARKRGMGGGWVWTREVGDDDAGAVRVGKSEGDGHVRAVGAENGVVACPSDGASSELEGEGKFGGRSRGKGPVPELAGVVAAGEVEWEGGVL